MIRTTHTDDALLADMVFRVDPFTLAAPCWSVRVAYQLPPITISTLAVPKEKVTTMPIRTVEETKAPSRLHVRGGISSKTDYMEVLAELNKNQKGVALIVDMDRAAWAETKKPEVTFANSLRRRFEMSGLQLTAYMTAPFQITVRRLTAIEVREREASKKTRKPRSK
jgi:hypothetical protein